MPQGMHWIHVEQNSSTRKGSTGPIRDFSLANRAACTRYAIGCFFHATSHVRAPFWRVDVPLKMRSPIACQKAAQAKIAPDARNAQQERVGPGRQGKPELGAVAKHTEASQGRPARPGARDGQEFAAADRASPARHGLASASMPQPPDRLCPASKAVPRHVARPLGWPERSAGEARPGGISALRASCVCLAVDGSSHGRS